jgi:predicted transcriptional regulator
MPSPVPGPTGRPAQPHVALVVQVSPELRERLDRLAAATKRTLASHVREALNAHVSAQPAR